MTPAILLTFLLGYFALLIGVAYFTSRNSSDNASFFIANRNSKWYLVAFGMIGTALSGVTFISVPGAVGNNSFGYFQFILGNAVGFVIVATVLLPLYYRMNLISIYTYLEKRLGHYSYKTGAVIFLISRTIGSAFRLYLVAIVLQRFIFDAWNVPFWLTIVLCLLLIWLYTHKGGLKTIIITDTLQTVFLLLSVVLSIIFISKSLHLDVAGTFEAVKTSSYSTIFFWEDFMGSKSHFIKQFVGGIFVTIAMTGLDQDLMQKNLSMKTIGEAQKNMFTFTLVFVIMNIFFLSVGALLYLYAAKNGISVAALQTPDHLYPEIALNHLNIVPGIIFMMGLTAATFATTDSALTALTTSFCVDFLHFDKKTDQQDPKLVTQRHLVHIGFSVLMVIVILIFKVINNDSVVNSIFTAAGYTYGPLLGLFSFGLLTKRAVHDKLVPYLCLASPVLCYIINSNSMHWFGYTMSFELIVLNGLITFILLWLTGKPSVSQTKF
ncbi:sodium:solute symporter [Pedobacter antarcticus]|uniref:Sodium:solute symporter n=2 Tax=Pedobacter antarcticus TaxID=34086 RepID=A0A081PCW3_9SPHI|nr:sodium:solute symporter [Pedobacter antarcticus]KEQ28536.1 sodium:solute symporter [Pedobacter antarcticus 4BY]SDM31884.1 Na+/proline symporter [Pedobacter antarcticus]SFF17936.1 Na+/proline symporter [Pedobacter antarcticus]